MITTFKIFETKLRDLITDTKNLNKKGEDSIEKKIIDKQLNKEFVNNAKLIKEIYLKDFDKILKFKYNNNVNHDLIKRIKERTHLKSVSEFNDFFSKVIKSVIPEKLGKKGIDIKAKYAFHMKENNFSILMFIDPDALIDDYYVSYHGVSLPYYTYVITIFHNTEYQNYYKIIEVDDTNF